jgi:hypothetical protein
MVKLTFDTNLSQLNGLPVQGCIDKILQVYYPQLILRIKLIAEALAYQTNGNMAAERAVLLKVQQELNGMMEKEKLLLFPLFLILDREQRTTGCEPFKLVKKHYQSLLSGIQHLKKMIESRMGGEANLHRIIEETAALEKGIIGLQRAKEKYLFFKFRSCDNQCKLAIHEQNQ